MYSNDVIKNKNKLILRKRNKIYNQKPTFFTFRLKIFCPPHHHPYPTLMEDFHIYATFFYHGTSNRLVVKF